VTTAQELQEKGVKLYDQHDYEAAAKVFNEAIEAYSEAGQEDMAAEMQVNIGLVYRALGENSKALEIMQQALTTFQESDDQLRSAQVLGNLGGVYLELDDKEQAYECYRRAADMFQELGEKKLYGETMIAMARMQVKDGKLWMGAATYEVGLENLDSLSASQKVIKGLIGLRNRFTGGSPG